MSRHRRTSVAREISIGRRKTRDTDARIGRRSSSSSNVSHTRDLRREDTRRRRGYVDTRVRILASKSRGPISSEVARGGPAKDSERGLTLFYRVAN